MKIDDVYNYIVPTYFQIGDYEIVILQNPEGDVLTIRVEHDREK